MDKVDFMVACREGGPAMDRALRALDRNFHAVLYRECRRVVHDAEISRDLVQETFIKVWRRCGTFQGSSDLLPWIRTILRHTILDRLRADRREVAFEVEDDGSGPEPRPDPLGLRAVPMPDEDAHAGDAAACFERCWQRFEAESPEHAAVISWIAEDGLDNAQIAELLGRTPGATREYVRQCRRRARYYLAEWHELVFGLGSPAAVKDR